MSRIVMNLAVLGLAAFLITTVLPMIDAGRAEQTAVASLGEVVGQIEGVDLADNGLTVTSTDGQTLRLSIDPKTVKTMAAEIMSPSGNSSFDTMRYGAFALIGLRMLIGLVSASRVLAQRPARHSR